jgi:hypothetical protein
VKKHLIFFLVISILSVNANCQERIFEKCLDRICIQIETISIQDNGIVIFQRSSDSGKYGRVEGSWNLTNDTTLVLKKDLITTTYTINHFLNSEFLISNSQLNNWSKIKFSLVQYSEKDEDYVYVKSFNGDLDRKEILLRGMLGRQLAKICGKDLRDIYYRK